jgi:hypothetical protein
MTVTDVCQVNCLRTMMGGMATCRFGLIMASMSSRSWGSENWISSLSFQKSAVLSTLTSGSIFALCEFASSFAAAMRRLLMRTSAFVRSARRSASCSVRFLAPACARACICIKSGSFSLPAGGGFSEANGTGGCALAGFFSGGFASGGTGSATGAKTRYATKKGNMNIRLPPNCQF